MTSEQRDPEALARLCERLNSTRAALDREAAAAILALEAELAKVTVERDAMKAQITRDNEIDGHRQAALDADAATLREIASLVHVTETESHEQCIGALERIAALSRTHIGEG